MHNTTIPLGAITANVARKFRASDDESAVEDYARAYQDGADMPRLVVFRGLEPGQYILADGDKRLRALTKNKTIDIPVTVHDGDYRDALLYAAKCNITNGVRPSNADKRKTVKFFLADEEWGKRTLKWIADAAGVSTTLVKQLMAEEEAEKEATKGREERPEPAPLVREGRDGKVYPTSKAPRKPKPGKELFDFEAYDRQVGAVSRGIDDIATAYKLKEDVEYHSLNRLYREFHKALIKWKKKVLKLKPEKEAT